jgi:hypothetical protein
MSRCFRGCIVMSVLAISPAGCGESSLPFDEASTRETKEAVVDCSVAYDKELLITDVRVVQDARAENNGPWSFGGIMQAMAGDTNAQDFVKNLVESWLTDQVVDGATVKARPKIKETLLDPWKARSTNGTYDLAQAPFDLLAIVYRPDLRKDGSIGSGGGEGRFVYGLRNVEGRMLPFTLIAEFTLPKRGGRSAENWASDWHSLGKLALGSSEYKEKLEEITNRFASTEARADRTLNQLRTNEIALDLGTGRAPVWELREFHIASDGHLHTARPALTPLASMNGTSTLTTFVQQNQKKIEEGTHKVPVKFNGTPFSAGSAEAPSNSFLWNVPGVSTDLQQKFSLQTCNGCHAGNTATNFLHVAPSRTGGAATLSDFVLNTEMPKRTETFKKLLGCQ